MAASSWTDCLPGGARRTCGSGSGTRRSSTVPRRCSARSRRIAPRTERLRSASPATAAGRRLPWPAARSSWPTASGSPARSSSCQPAVAAVAADARTGAGAEPSRVVGRRARDAARGLERPARRGRARLLRLPRARGAPPLADQPAPRRRPVRAPLPLCAPAGYGASPGMVRRCLERCDEDGIAGRVHVLRALSDTRPVQTQGPVWQIAGRTV